MRSDNEEAVERQIGTSLIHIYLPEMVLPERSPDSYVANLTLFGDRSYGHLDPRYSIREPGS